MQGRYENVRITSAPAGARVDFAGESMTTPATVTVRRTKIAVLRAIAPGYAPRCQIVRGLKHGGMVAVDSVPFALPLALDAVLGTLEDFPESLHVTLRPLDPGEAPRPLPEDVEVIESWDVSGRNICLPP